MIKPLAEVSSDAVVQAHSISRRVLRAHAGFVDRENRFPAESFDALRASGLLGLFVPPEFGGIGGDSPTYCRVAHALGRGCLSSALNYVMHVQQVVVMVDYAMGIHDEAIRAIAQGETLIASVTSERGKGGDLSRAQAPIVTNNDGTITLKREAPIVSYAGQADAFLVLMRSGEKAPETDTRLVWVHRSDAIHAVKGGWNTMGMRGTQSVPIDFEGVLPADRVLPRSFKEMGDRTLLPLGVIGFASVWSGAARGILDEVTLRTRERGGAPEPVLASLARFRAQLDLVDTYILQLAERIDRVRAGEAPANDYWIALNSVKVAASETAFEVVDGLIQVVGLKDGFLQNDELPIERVFRDLRSASLMHHNERLLAVSGRMMLMERLTMDEDAATGPLA